MRLQMTWQVVWSKSYFNKKNPVADIDNVYGNLVFTSAFASREKYFSY